MRYIAVFDIPDGYGMGCACGKMALKGKERYEDDDFENCYAQIEPLSEDKAEVLDKYNAVLRIMFDLGLSCAYDMPSFWTHHGKDYKVIQTNWHKGYMKALEDVENEIRKQFGFAERDNVIDHFFNLSKAQDKEQEHER